MFVLNGLPDYGKALDTADADVLGVDAAEDVERFLAHREGHRPTPLVALPNLARELGLGAIHMKDEGHRLGLGSFKALGGSYAVIRLVLEEASRRLGRAIDVAELHSPEVQAVARELTVACATDGNHGRSVAQGAQLVGARCAIFVHSGVSDGRIAAIARLGAEIVKVDGNYDESVAEASRVAEQNSWITVSDTSWPGYERIPGFVMQGYTALLREALRELPEPPTHVFVQAGVGGIAAAVAGHLVSGSIPGGRLPRRYSADICTCGGITEVKKICDMAHVYDATVQIHVCGGPISTAAALHMETAIPNFIIHELHRYALLEPNTRTCKHNYMPKNGMYEVPELAGLGQELTEETIRDSDKVRVS